MATLTVDFVKKDKTAFKATDGNWYNSDKKANLIFDMAKGTVVECEVNGNWVKSFSVGGKTGGSAAAVPAAHQTTSTDKDTQIARAVALKAAVDAGVIDNDDEGAFAASYAKFKEVCDEFFDYLTTGKFDKGE